MVDRYVDTEKPEMLAKLYLAYLEGKILWVEFTMYAEVIDRFLPRDYRMLQTCDRVTAIRNIGSEPILRLMAQGLVAERYYNNENPMLRGPTKFIGTPPDPFKTPVTHWRNYQRTEFGDKLVEILGDM